MQYIDEAVDVAIAMRTLVPTNQTSQKAEEVPQVQHRDKVIDVPVVLQRQETNIQTKEKKSNVVRTWCFDLEVDELVVVGAYESEGAKEDRGPTGFGANRVQTVREDKDTRSPEAEGSERAGREQNRLESDDRCADGWLEVKEKADANLEWEDLGRRGKSEQREQGKQGGRQRGDAEDTS